MRSSKKPKWSTTLITRVDDFQGAKPETTTWTYSDVKGNGKIKGGLERVTSPNLTRTLRYDNFGRVEQATSVIDSQTFTQRTGYNGTADKVDWIQYPSGLSVRNTYDDYGFPKTVEGISLSNTRYTQFQTASRELIDLQRDFEQWKNRNLSDADLAKLEHHESEVRRLGGYLSDFHESFEKHPSKQRFQNVAQRYIDLLIWLIE